MNRILQNIIILFLICCFSSCKDEPQGRVTIFKQWHLDSSTSTRSILESKNLDQYTNQIDIYQTINKLIVSGQTSMIIAEGCEGVIDMQFKLVFNGWNMKSLKELYAKTLVETAVNEPNLFDQVLAPIAMKLKVKHPELDVYCGDNLNLISQNLLAMSELRGFVGFHERLVSSKVRDPAKFELYSKQLKSLFPNESITNPIDFSLKKSIENLDAFERLILKRNKFFYATAVKHLIKNPTIIIGGLHVQDLEQKLLNKSIFTKVIIPKGYVDDEQKLIKGMKKLFQQKIFGTLHFLQVPRGFNHKLFKVKYKLNESSFMTEFEKKDLKSRVKGKIPFDLILSDFDNDGIRDFTVSSHGKDLFVSAEDTDWDNDGVSNLHDTKLGDFSISNSDKSKLVIDNNYKSKSPVTKISNLIQKNFFLLADKGVSHELLVLEILEKLVSKTSMAKSNVQFIKASKPKFKYGRNVFFSYITHTNTLEYYPVELSKFIATERLKRFSGVQLEVIVKQYVVPLIIHSLAHEFGHSLDGQREKYETSARKNGWTWNEESYKGKYLKMNRHKSKIINTVKVNTEFRQLDSESWNQKHKVYTSEVKKLFSLKGSDNVDKFINNAVYRSKVSNIEKIVGIEKFNFLNNENIPSLYSLKSPSEWFAEVYAICIFREVYPLARNLKRSIQIEHLLGINPRSVEGDICLQL